MRIVAENFPIYTCPNDGIEWHDGEASLEFLQKELKILRERDDRGFRQSTIEAIRAAQRNLEINRRKS